MDDRAVDFVAAGLDIGVHEQDVPDTSNDVNHEQADLAVLDDAGNALDDFANGLVEHLVFESHEKDESEVVLTGMNAT